MSRVSKGKMKHLWDLYGVWDIISYRSATMWYFEPSPEFKATVDKWLIQMEDPKVVARMARFKQRMDEHRASPYLYERPNKGYYDGCRKLDSEFDMETFFTIGKLENPVYLTYMRDKPRLEGVPGKVIAYDIEADVYRVPCGGFNHEHSASGRIYAKGSLDGIKGLDIAETCPKTLDVFDDEKFDRLVSGMLATPPTA